MSYTYVKLLLLVSGVFTIMGMDQTPVRYPSYYVQWPHPGIYHTRNALVVSRAAQDNNYELEDAVKLQHAVHYAERAVVPRIHQLKPDEWRYHFDMLNAQLSGKEEPRSLRSRMMVVFNLTSSVKNYTDLIAVKDLDNEDGAVMRSFIERFQNEPFEVHNKITQQELAILKKYVFVPPMPQYLEKAMREYCSNLHKLIQQHKDPLYIASFAHVGFTAMHPYDYANGRQARLLANAILLATIKKAALFLDEREYTVACSTIEQFQYYLLQQLRETERLAQKQWFDNPTFCNYCQNPVDKRCAKCKNVYYCSIECQKADLKNHKPFCY